MFYESLFYFLFSSQFYCLLCLTGALTFKNYFITLTLSLSWKSKWQPTPVPLPGKSYGWRGLVGYSPWGRRVRQDWVTSLSLFTFMHWRRKWQPTPVFLLENPRDTGAYWAAISGVAQSRTRLKRLSSSKSYSAGSSYFCRHPIPLNLEEGGVACPVPQKQ